MLLFALTHVPALTVESIDLNLGVLYIGNAATYKGEAIGAPSPIT